MQLKIVSVKALEGITKELVVENQHEAVTEGWTAYNTECNSGNYVIRNNYFHENRARGLLLQSSNGLVFSENTVDIGGFFDNASVQGRAYFGKYCNSVFSFIQSYRIVPPRFSRGTIVSVK